MAKIGKLNFESPVHISKRVELPVWQRLLIRVLSGVVALVICGIFTSLMKGGDFGGFFSGLFDGAFGTKRRIFNLIEETALLLIISLAVTPAFKMRFWNIGAEGQVLFGALLGSIVAYDLGPSMSNNPTGLLILIFVVSCLGGLVWALIPAVFKAIWNTNETLFTLMLNYIAKGLILFMIAVWTPNGQTSLDMIPDAATLPKIGGQAYIINYIVVAIVTVFIYIYLKSSKHGYELTVVGESINTAKYIGLNVKKVIIRTMALSGLICGIAGFLILSGHAYTINDKVAAGRGFTAILVSWLSGFNPIIMIVMAFLVGFINIGGKQVATNYEYRGSYTDIIAAIFFFGLIASNFFINYKLSLSNNASRKLRKLFNIKEKKIEKIETVEVDTKTEDTKEEKSIETNDNNETTENTNTSINEETTSETIDLVVENTTESEPEDTNSVEEKTLEPKPEDTSNANENIVVENKENVEPITTNVEEIKEEKIDEVIVENPKKTTNKVSKSSTQNKPNKQNYKPKSSIRVEDKALKKTTKSGNANKKGDK